MHLLFSFTTIIQLLLFNFDITQHRESCKYEHAFKSMDNKLILCSYFWFMTVGFVNLNAQTDFDQNRSMNAAIMPRLHLLRSSYDLSVYDFPYDFFSIVGCYKLRRMCLHCLRSPHDFFRRQTRTKPYRDLAYIVQQPQGYRTIIVLSSRPLYINCTMRVG